MMFRRKRDPQASERHLPVVRSCALALAGLLAFAGPAGAAAGGCHSVSGDFVASTPPSCSSFFCTEGQLSGDLDGLYSFVAYGVAPNGDLLGHSTITLSNGAVITSDDQSHLFGPPAPGNQFVTTVNFSGGTRQFAHATGGLSAPGTFTATGTEGTYSGEYCLGNGADS
jgi:hypothetical protein